VRRFYRFRSPLPSSRAGFGTLLLEFLGFWHQVDAGATGIHLRIAKATGVCARRLGAG
jgi:hypothetical protein